MVDVTTDPSAPPILTTAAEARHARDQLPGTVALVMTMGGLHAGHLSLVRRAREVADHVVVSIYVNPLQFGSEQDLATYPRDLDADVAFLSEYPIDFIFAPDDAEMYPRPPMVRVDPGPVADILEGASRPGHFAGVVHVVNKVFNVIRPHSSIFGQKDAQQLALVTTMVEDLNLDIDILSAPIERDEQGLALSSRNQHLSPEAHTAALAIPNAIEASRDNAAHGVTAVGRTASEILSAASGVDPDYVAVVEPETFLSLADDTTGTVLLVVAAVVDGIRLLDNALIDIPHSAIAHINSDRYHPQGPANPQATATEGP